MVDKNRKGDNEIKIERYSGRYKRAEIQLLWKSVRTSIFVLLGKTIEYYSFSCKSKQDKKNEKMYLNQGKVSYLMCV